MSKVTSMRDAVAAIVHDGDVVAIEGFTHLICFAAGHEIIRQRKRDLTLARLTPDLIYDQMVAAGTARKLVFSWLGNPGRRRAARHPPPRRGRRSGAARAGGVQPLRHGRPVHGRRLEPALLPAALLLRDGPAEGEPADPADPLAVRRGDGLRGSAAQAGRDRRPRPAGRRRGQHPDVGPARLPEGGRLRRRAGHRRGRGAGRRGRHPGRPEPHGHPRPDRRRRRRGAVRGAIPRTSRAPTTATTASTATGTRSAARPPPRRPGSTSGSTASAVGRSTSRSSGPKGWPSLRPSGEAPSGSVDYGVYR